MYTAKAMAIAAAAAEMQLDWPASQQILCLPEHYPEYVGDEQCEADVQREAFSVLRLLDGKVLRNIRHHTADNHGYSRQQAGEGTDGTE